MGREKGDPIEKFLRARYLDGSDDNEFTKIEGRRVRLTYFTAS